MEIVATPVVIGPFFTGNTNPDVEGFLTHDAGGYVDLTGASAQFIVRRWNQIKEEAYGPVVTGGLCSFGATANGEVIYSWTTAPLPVTPGWYCGRFIITFPGAKTQDSQDCVFEVQEGSPTVLGPTTVVVDHADVSPKTLLAADANINRIVIVQATATEAATGGPEFDVGSETTDPNAVFDDVGAGVWALGASYLGVCVLPKTEKLVCTIIGAGTAGKISMRCTALPPPP
jgi:hypothetical protein